MSLRKADPAAGAAPGRHALAHRLYEWLNERYEISGLVELMRHKQVPITRMSFFYYFGGVSLFLFVVQVVSGILLLMYYVPTEDQAYESVQYIMSKVKFGWLVRSIHSWSANVMILCVFIHMFSVFFMRAYRKPRELTWMSGVGLLGLALAFGFSGYLLPWNELSFFATKVGTDIVGELPVVGAFLLEVLRGGEEVSGRTLSRFFGLHVAILPGVITCVLGLHLLFIQRQGMSAPPEWLARPPAERRSMKFFPQFLLRDVLLWLIVFNALAAVSVYWPSHLGVKADPFAPAPAGIKPEWYFLAQYQTLKLLPATVGPISGELAGILGMSLGGIVILLLPFIDRTPEGGPRRRWLDVAGGVVLTYFIIMTVLGHVVQ
ncbi:MAG: cytochrome b N-terminal domain-containing protein [Candidatus Sumerlaeia bacterium]